MLIWHLKTHSSFFYKFVSPARLLFYFLSFLPYSIYSHIYFMIRSKPFQFCEWIHKCSILTTSASRSVHNHQTQASFMILLFECFSAREHFCLTETFIFVNLQIYGSPVTEWWAKVCMSNVNKMHTRHTHTHTHSINMFEIFTRHKCVYKFGLL